MAKATDVKNLDENPKAAKPDDPKAADNQPVKQPHAEGDAKPGVATTFDADESKRADVGKDLTNTAAPSTGPRSPLSSTDPKVIAERDTPQQSGGLYPTVPAARQAVEEQDDAGAVDEGLAKEILVALLGGDKAGFRQWMKENAKKKPGTDELFYDYEVYGLEMSAAAVAIASQLKPAVQLRKDKAKEEADKKKAEEKEQKEKEAAAKKSQDEKNKAAEEKAKAEGK